MKITFVILITLIIILLALPSFAGVPVISGVVVDDVGHSSIRVTWQTDVAADNQRIQYGPSGSLRRTYYTYAPYYGAPNQQLILSGLNTPDLDASRTVSFCVQSHNAAGWSACTVQTATLLPVPSPHPAEAVRPTLFAPIPEPSPAGCTVQTVAANLSDLQAKISAASANQSTVCQVVNIPAGAIGNVYAVIPPASDADTVSAASVNAGTNTITLSSARNTYSNGDRVRVDGDGVDTGAGIPTGLSAGADYCVTSLSGSTMQLTFWPGCASVAPLRSAGSGTWFIMPFPPRHSNWVQIRSAVSNSALPPDGVRQDPQWQAANRPKWNPNCTGINENICNSLRIRGLAHHWYIGPGIDFATPSSGQNDTTDPTPWPTKFTNRPSNSYIAIKRNWFTGAGFPERSFHTIKIEGSYVDFSENYLNKIDYWKPVRTGIAPTISSSTVLSFASGTYNMGIGNCQAIPSFSGTLSGAASGTAYVTIRPSDCAAVITRPPGAGIACSGCTVLDGSTFPVNGAGRYSQGLVAACDFAAGSWTACRNYDDVNSYFISVFYNDAIQNIVSCGPGPLRIANNFESSHGIFWHLDDSAFSGSCNSPLVVASDVLFERNVFATPDIYINGKASNNGLVYRNRNQWECKRCSRVWLRGNEFFGNYRDFANDGPTIIINANASFSTPPVMSTASDFTATSNLIHDASNGIQLGGGPPGSASVPQLGRRMTLRNNLIRNLNGYQYTATLPSGFPASGWCFQLSHGGEDVIIDHNTCYSAAGRSPSALQVVSKMIEGLQFTNNALYIHDDQAKRSLLIDWGSNGIGVPNCFNVLGTAGVNCFTNGVRTFANNLLITGYSNSRSMTGDSDAGAFATTWASSNSFIPLQSKVPARTASVKWRSESTGDLRFRPDSLYVSGGASRATDNLDVGVDQDALENALGWVKNVRALNVTSNGASIFFHAPDKGNRCVAAYGLGADPAAWTVSAADTSSGAERSIQLSGLNAATAYFYQIWCAGTAATATHNFRTP